MTISCATCSSALEEGSLVCPNCGTTVAVDSAIAVTGSTDAPAYKHDEDLNGIGGWLILPAIGLAIAPFVALYIIFMVDLPVLTDSKYQEVLTRHPAQGLQEEIAFTVLAETGEAHDALGRGPKQESGQRCAIPTGEMWLFLHGSDMRQVGIGR